MKKLTLDEFKNSLSGDEPPAGFSAHAKALWFAGKGDWEKAHDIVQDLPDPMASRIHAFLHRQEGDLSNASYWYSKSGAQMPSLNLDQEWEELASHNLE
ncbi:MAG: hypothetical protein ACHQEM_06055 [Chitinophagales bacterium]